MVSYYNEIDPYAAQWLRNLIANKLIADGDVDERSICDVAAADLHGYTQCHFFAGIGVWSYALRLAGWPDDRPVWTGSCPCQPFSAAGKGKGFDDDRHLWPEFHRLISECRPPVVFGEQVASKDGLGWLDTVHADLQASGYACGAVDWCAAGVGAPHIRQRLWFVGERLADAQGQRYGQREVGDEESPQRASGGGGKDERLWQPRPSGASGDGGLADTERREWRSGGLRRFRQVDGAESGGASAELAGSRDDGRLADASLDGRRQGVEDGGRLRSGDSAEGTAGRSAINSDVSGWLADADEGQRGRLADCERRQRNGAQAGWQQGDGEPQSGQSDGGLGHHHHQGLEGQRSGHQTEAGWLGAVRPVAEAGELGGLADAESAGSSYGRAGAIQSVSAVNSGTVGGLADDDDDRCGARQWDDQATRHGHTLATASDDDRQGQARPTNGHWGAADWLHCRDGRWRPVEPGTFPLVNGAPARVGRLRAYGNAIVPQVAAEVIGAYLDARP